MTSLSSLFSQGVLNVDYVKVSDVVVLLLQELGEQGILVQKILILPIFVQLTLIKLLWQQGPIFVILFALHFRLIIM